MFPICIGDLIWHIQFASKRLRGRSCWRFSRIAYDKILLCYSERGKCRKTFVILERNPIYVRIAAGLLKSEEKANLSRGNTAKTIALTEEEEKNLKIKEIARKKREMKKQKTLREKALQMEAEDSVPASHRTGVVHETKSVTKEKLISRITQQFKGGCTGEILAQSTTVNSLGYRNSICSNIYSGLTVLLARDEGEELDDFYHEMFPELLIKESEMSALIKCHSKVGLVCATPPSSGFGVEVKSFGASLSRLNWVHIAFVGTESPTNRVTLYLVCSNFVISHQIISNLHFLVQDGYLVKQLKDCAFPLPMGSALGPADSLSSFQGAAIDMRYWYTPRSAVQIKDTMHRLLEFHEPISASNTGKNKSKAKEKDMVNLSTDGLIGWWTFEDGPGSVEVTDVTSHRFKTKVTKHLLESVGHTTKKGDIRKTISSFLKKQFNRSSWKWVDADSVPIREAVIGGAQDSGLPLPSYRMRGLCPFEIKRYRLAKSGRELHREIDCPLG